MRTDYETTDEAGAAEHERTWGTVREWLIANADPECPGEEECVCGLDPECPHP